MALLGDYLLRQDLANIKSFDGNAHAQPGDVRSPLFLPPNGALAPWSPQSPVGPSTAGHLSSLDLDISPQGFPLGGNEYSQASNGQVPFITSSGVADSPTPWSIIDSSLQSPVGPSASGHIPTLDFPHINPQGFRSADGNEHSQQSQPGNGQVLSRLVIPPTRAVGPPTSSITITSPSAQSPVDPIRAVGSPLIQQAAAKRRKNGGIYYECPFLNCNSTLTKPHNLEYHINAHMGVKPHKCSACEFATSYPTTLGQHVKRSCKGKKGRLRVIP
ncbi:hypothetical protein JOM56_013993 [Amanita muscaria]